MLMRNLILRETQDDSGATPPIAKFFRHNMSSFLRLPLICAGADNARFGIFAMRCVVKSLGNT